MSGVRFARKLSRDAISARPSPSSFGRSDMLHWIFFFLGPTRPFAVLQTKAGRDRNGRARHVRKALKRDVNKQHEQDESKQRSKQRGNVNVSSIIITTRARGKKSIASLIVPQLYLQYRGKNEKKDMISRT